MGSQKALYTKKNIYRYNQCFLKIFYQVLYSPCKRITNFSFHPNQNQYTSAALSKKKPGGMLFYFYNTQLAYRLIESICGKSLGANIDTQKNMITESKKKNIFIVQS